MKLNLVLADSDAAYLERLSAYIQEKNTQFDLYSFSSEEYLESYLEKPNARIDILLCSNDLFSENVKLADSTLKIVLSDGTYDSNEEYLHIGKYQKAENIVTGITVMYAEATGRTDSAAGTRADTKIIGMYSPVGGCGKTALGIALGKAFAENGKKALYLNYECICSTADLFVSEKNMSDVFLAAMTRGGNAGLKVIANKTHDNLTGIDFVGCADSMLEFNELTAEQQCSIISQTDKMDKFDIIIVDFDSGLSNDKLKLLSVCDKIVMPFTLTATSIVKMDYFMKEREKHIEINNIVEKSVCIANMVDKNTAGMVSSLPFGKFVQVFSVPRTAALAELKSISSENCTARLAGVVNRIINQRG